MWQVRSIGCRSLYITMTSYRARWRLKSPTSRVFSQPFIQGADQSKHQSSASLAFVRGIHRWPVNSPHKSPVTRKMFPFDDVIIRTSSDTWPCLVAVGKEALFCYRWPLCEQRYAFIEISGSLRCIWCLNLYQKEVLQLTITVIFFSLHCQAAAEYVYVCECICTCACIYVHVYGFAHIFTCSKCVVENTTQLLYLRQNTMRCRYSMFNFLQNFHNRHPIIRPHGQDTGVSFVS